MYVKILKFGPGGNVCVVISISLIHYKRANLLPIDSIFTLARYKGQTSYRTVLNGYPQDGMTRSYVRNFPTILFHNVGTSYFNLHVIISEYIFLNSRNSIFGFQAQEYNVVRGLGSSALVGSSFMFIYSGLDSLFCGPKTLLI
ncbi:hypothetical protein AMTRI_Chr13g89130 [Amborella trichopoda]